MSLRLFASFAVVALLLPAPSSAQDFSVITDDRWCTGEHRHSGDDHRHCEVRETMLDGRDALRIDASPNGGVTVKSWGKPEIMVRARITISAESATRATEINGGISVRTGDVIKTDGLRTGADEWYSVSYEIFAPSGTDLDIETENGGIGIEGMDGRTRFETTNGGVELHGLGGDVKGQTTNGGISVELTGSAWSGSGLDVETRNGGVSIRVPNGYSAQLQTGTVNGRIKVDFPIMVEGETGKSLTTTLGDGGKTIRAVTTNGSVRIKRG